MKNSRKNEINRLKQVILGLRKCSSTGQDMPVMSFDSFICRWELLMCSNPQKCLKLLLMLGVVQSTLGLNSSLDRNSAAKLFEKKLEVLDRPLHIVVTGDKYIGKSSIVSHLVRNKRFQQNATASKVLIPSTSKKVRKKLF